MPLYLLARIGADRVAIAAEAVVAVIAPGPVTPVPRAPAHVAGLCALRSRVLTVVDACAAIGRGRVASAAPRAVVVDLGGQGYAILLDGVDDVVEAAAAQPCAAARRLLAPGRARPGRAWRRIPAVDRSRGADRGQGHRGRGLTDR